MFPLCLPYCSPAPPERTVPPRYSIAILHKEPGSTTTAGIFSAASPGGFFPSAVVLPSAGRATGKLPGGRRAASPGTRQGRGGGGPRPPSGFGSLVQARPRVGWGGSDLSAREAGETARLWARGRADTLPQAPSAAGGEVSQPRRHRGSPRLAGGSEGPGRVWSRRGAPGPGGGNLCSGWGGSHAGVVLGRSRAALA